MEANEPKIVIEGMEDLIVKDLQKHKGLLEYEKQSLISFKQARTHEIQKKKFYVKNINNKKFNKDSMETAVDQIRINIRMFSDKILLTEQAIEHHQMIVIHLTKQLEEQNINLVALHKFREKNGS